MPSAPDAEKRLWQSVLLISIEDALSGPGSEVGNARARLLECRRARDYLTTPTSGLAEVCSLAGIDMQALIESVAHRINTAPSPEELIADRRNVRGLSRREPAPSPPSKPEPIRYSFEGKTLTLEEWSVITGINFNTLNGRLRAGWSVEEALTTTVEEGKERSKSAATGGTWARGTPAKRLTHKGMTLTLAEWSKRTGLKVLTIKNRLRAGRSITEALDPSDKRKKDVEIY